MDLPLMIVIIAAIVAFIILMIYAIVSLSSIRKLINESIGSLQLFNKEFSELKEKLVESLEIVDETTKQIAVTSKNIESDASSLMNMFQPFKTLMDSLYNKVGPPLVQAATLVSATSKAINVFTNMISVKRKNPSD